LRVAAAVVGGADVDGLGADVDVVVFAGAAAHAAERESGALFFVQTTLGCCFGCGGKPRITKSLKNQTRPEMLSSNSHLTPGTGWTDTGMVPKKEGTEFCSSSL